MCARAVSAAIEKLEGVESVAVSLNEGTATVRLRTGNRLDPEQIRQVARDNGFTPKDARVRVRGRLVQVDGAPGLAVEGLDAAFSLGAPPGESGTLAGLPEVGAGLIVVGHLVETRDEAVPGRELLLLELEPDPP